MDYAWDFSSIVTYRAVLYKGFAATILLSSVALLTALVLGMVLCLMRTSTTRLLSVPAATFVNFFRNIPFIIQLFWLFYAVPVLTGAQAKPFLAAYLALSLYCGAYFAEIFRAGFQGVERGQWEAAKSIGIGYGSTLLHIVFPQALRRVIAPLTTQIIELVKLTTVASSIAYAELLYSGKLVADQEFRPLEAYTTVAVVLIALLVLLSLAGSWLERWLRLEQR